MEGLDLTKVLVLSAVLAIIIELGVALLLVVVGNWYGFTVRKEIKTQVWVDRWWHKFDFITKEVPCIAFTAVLIFMGIGLTVFTGNFLIGFMVIGVLLLFILGPRFIVDMIKALKYDSKTGKSDTLEELKAKVKALEDK